MSIVGEINSVVSAAARSAYDFFYQVSPITLSGGLFSGAPGGDMSIAALTGAVSLIQGAITNQGISLNDFPIRFMVVPGGMLINNSVATYPFANQYVAGNANIFQPLPVALVMIAPVNDIAGYLTKQSLLSGIQNTFQSHILAGGTFDIMTPASNYYDCLLTTMSDITGGDTKQQQIIWQLDFVKPLITQQQAQAAMGTLLQKISNGSPVTSPTWSGQSPLPSGGSSIAPYSSGVA